MGDLRPWAIWTDVPDEVRAWVSETLRREGHAVGDWPEAAPFRAALIYAAASARALRYEEAGRTRTAALEAVARDFGLSDNAVKQMFWRVSRQVDPATATAA